MIRAGLQRLPQDAQRADCIVTMYSSMQGCADTGNVSQCSHRMIEIGARNRRFSRTICVHGAQ